MSTFRLSHGTSAILKDFSVSAAGASGDGEGGGGLPLGFGGGGGGDGLDPAADELDAFGGGGGGDPTLIGIEV
eukprot:1205200-Amphidinium_carterae.1